MEMMVFSLKASRSRSPKAFSLLEALFTVTVIGILAAVAIETTHRLRQGASSTKLDSDVASINQSIKVYLANGGSLEETISPAAVLEKLKTRRESTEAAAFAGFKSDMIDHRVIAVHQTEAEAASVSPRAVWNASKKCFEVSRGGSAGVARFDLNDALGAADHGTEVRAAGAVALNRGDGWIWDYEDSAPQGPQVPAQIPLSMPLPTPPVAPAPPGRLAAPVFSVGGGSYRYDTYPEVIELTNPNGTGQLMVARNWSEAGIDWEPYTDPVAVEPGGHLLAYVAPTSGEHTESFTSSGTYELEIIDLQPAEIRTSASVLDLGSNSPVTVELINPNPEGYRSLLEYSISGGDFQPYNSALTINPSDYGAGFELAARVVASIRGFNASPAVGQWLPVKLRPPLIDKKQTDATFLITLFDTNPPDTATLRYSIKDLRTGSQTGWENYQAAFQINGSEYGKGFEVYAFAAAARPRYLDSDPSSAQGRSFFGTKVADRAILVLDVSGSMAWNGRLDSVKAEAKKLLSAMPADGKIAIITFSSGVKTDFRYQTTTSSKITQAQLIVDSLKASGSTNYSGALTTALNMVKANPDVEQVVFLSDGAPTAGDTSTSGILRLVDSIVARNVALTPIGYQMTTAAENDLIQKMKERGAPKLPAK